MKIEGIYAPKEVSGITIIVVVVIIPLVRPMWRVVRHFAAHHLASIAAFTVHMT